MLHSSRSASGPVDRSILAGLAGLAGLPGALSGRKLVFPMMRIIQAQARAV